MQLFARHACVRDACSVCAVPSQLRSQALRHPELLMNSWVPCSPVAQLAFLCLRCPMRPEPSTPAPTCAGATLAADSNSPRPNWEKEQHQQAKTSPESALTISIAAMQGAPTSRDAKVPGLFRCRIHAINARPSKSLNGKHTTSPFLDDNAA